MCLPQEIRDLLWVIESPSLISGPQVIESDALDHRIDPDTISLKSLRRHLQRSRTRRVGAYCEALVLFWLTKIRGLDVLHYRHQLRRDGRTIGELDFVYRDEAGELVHLETAVKFYLFHAESTEDPLVGPEANDTFGKKMQRLFEHQLPLSRHLPQRVDRRLAMVKGRLFYPLGEGSPRPLAERVSPSHLRGTWIRHGRWGWLDRQPDDLVYRILGKPHWLAPEIASRSDPDFVDRERLKAVLGRAETKQRPSLVSMLRFDGDLAAETGRFFVVPQAWPVA